jgi:hypothetical protein
MGPNLASIKKRLGIGSGQTPDLRRSRSPSVDPSSKLQYIVVKSNTLLHPRTRSQWEIIGRLQFGKEEWRLDKSSRIAERDDKRHVGNIDWNQFSNNKDSWPQCSILKLINYELPLFIGTEASNLLDESNDSDSTDVSEFVGSDFSDELVPKEMRSIPAEILPRHHLGDIIANIMTCDELPISQSVHCGSPDPADTGH